MPQVCQQVVYFSLQPNHHLIASSDKHRQNSTNQKKKKPNPLSQQTSHLHLPLSKTHQSRRIFLQHSKVLSLKLYLVVHRSHKQHYSGDRSNFNQLRTYLVALADKRLSKAAYLGTVQRKVKEYLASKLKRRNLTSLAQSPLRELQFLVLNQ